ncbi:Variant surface glycoprotein [Trypanosoma congolense IL3000]|uniref:Variant surface glycoprotein n=1 Tax=Trypanosoma congolense (strain IL3000) TaxID=1068625 RepID=F9WBC2_TRYCI|nr:Variant surface glycoprotein [Trypanosoma congolense IL3000]
MMKFLVVVMVVIGVVRADEVGAAATLTNHNEASHRALCDFLKVAVDKWEHVKTRGPTDPLKKALKDTIFGYGSGEEDVEVLKSKLPSDYDEVGSGLLSDRSLWCGQPRDEDRVQQRRWPGHSGPHDLVCLCTAGENGWPVNSTSDTGSTLCGHNKDALEAGEKWWSGTKNMKKKDAIQKTWEVTVNQCLSGYSQGTDLVSALQKFKDKIKKTIFDDETRYILGEGGTGWSPCNGNAQVCVTYYPNRTSTNTWWSDLEKAFVQDEKIEKQRAEEEKRKQQQEAAKKDKNKTEDIKSTTPTTNQTEQNKTATLHETMRKLNLTSGTPIIPPSSWLLRAVFLI